MSKLAQLRERRNAKAVEARTLNDRYPAEQRMPAAEASQLDALLAEIEAIDGEIGRETRLAQLAAEQTDMLLNRTREQATRDPSRHSDHSRALKAFLAGGLAALSDTQRAEHQMRVTPDIQQSMHSTLHAAMSTGVPAEGGYTVATEYQRQLETAMKDYGGILQVASMIQTGSGAVMNFPTADATSEEGEIIGESTDVTGGDTQFGNAQLTVYKYSSKKIALPWELIQDSFIDIELYIQELLALRLGRILSKHCTIGSGAGQPRGILTGSTLGKAGATGQTVTVTYDDLVDLEHSVDPAYRRMPGTGWMFHDQTLKVVRKIKDSNARPIFVPGYESGSPGGAPDTLMGRPITISQEMPVMAANAKSILFGLLRKYMVRRVMDLTMFRMTDSAFTLKGQVGFVAFQRLGGNLIDAGGAVKHYANSAT
ncbi:phage major capsid protein [Aquabacterium sp. A7-Y]|uniref:phage major capsid protein n=1 Tax=Aquabacterium sp. A7-Y TaxID=1349605 RepID=UPI00223D14A5|nr:phage major capsid protein [Aquabacterium sp. A7-Y]MCW7542009.1 phage major capsid protein [Aquabacterium sp. A7-Y]